MRSDSILLSDTNLASSSLIIVPDLIKTFPSSIKSSRRVLPKILSDKGSIISSPSLRSAATIPFMVPQSISDITTSWATSTSLRVKYPASAVLRAVSAKPFLAPWVDIKYSWTDRPSLKLDVIGDSIISPFPPVIDF